MLLVFFRCDLFLVDKILVSFYSYSALFAEVKWDLPHHHKRHQHSSIYPKTPTAAPPAPRYEQVPRANAKVSKIVLLRLWRSSLFWSTNVNIRYKYKIQMQNKNAKASKIVLLRLWGSSLSCHHLDSSGIWIAAVKCCSGILLQLSASESGSLWSPRSLWSLWSFWAHVLWSLQSHVTRKFQFFLNLYFGFSVAEGVFQPPCLCGCWRRRQAKHWCLPWQKCQRESPTSFKAFPDAITYFSES